MILRISKYTPKTYFGEDGPYPAWKKTREIPVTFIAEYKRFILFRVESHFSKSGYSCGLSVPYNVTIDKDMIERGWIEIS